MGCACVAEDPKPRGLLRATTDKVGVAPGSRFQGAVFCVTLHTCNIVRES